MLVVLDKDFHPRVDGRTVAAQGDQGAYDVAVEAFVS
jgi:hypothetical protein